MARYLHLSRADLDRLPGLPAEGLPVHRFFILYPRAIRREALGQTIVCVKPGLQPDAAARQFVLLNARRAVLPQLGGEQLGFRFHAIQS